ncbi:hypothetical protein HK102_002721 [Quaeritorhiza haematococci]|nr:hypothetical protein HK102_002721 [Quaeritorhiza haematococci]
MVPVRLVNWSLIGNQLTAQSRIDLQETIVAWTVNSETASKFPPATSYTLKFLKKLMDIVERAGFDPSELLFEKYVELLASEAETASQTRNESEAPSTPFNVNVPLKPCFKTYLLPSVESDEDSTKDNCVGQDDDPEIPKLREDKERKVIVLEDQVTVGAGVTGLRTWPACLKFVEYICANQHLVSGKRVLELGSGSGLLGYACASLGAKSVILTDGIAEVVERLRQNLLIQQGDWNSCCSVRHVVWDSVDGVTVDPPPVEDVDVVVCADVVYDPSIVAHLAKAFQYFLSGSRKIFGWMTVSVRHESTLELFLEACRENHVKVEKLQDAQFLNWFYIDEHINGVALFKLSSTGT